MDLNTALEWAATRSDGVLITIRKDGRPQSSDISYDVHDGKIRISVTADRAKTRNMARDNRVVMHVTHRPSWSYVSLDGTVELGPVATSPGDEACLQLQSQYRSVAGKDHPDWDEYFEAMISEGRLVVSLTPTSAVGQVH